MKKKVLIVDDSAFMRRLLHDLFSNQPDFEVKDVARNGKEAIEKTKALGPDLVTMDVEMPVIGGIVALEQIMKENPTPVLMISSLTRSGAEATMQALSLGAVDFVAKAAGSISSVTSIQDEILLKAREAVRVNMTRFQSKQSLSSHLPIKPKVNVGNGVLNQKERLVAIGTSTGGPRALQEVLTQLPSDLPCGVVIVQHMPVGFTKSLAERLNSLIPLRVKEAEHNDEVVPGTVFIAPGDQHMLIVKDAGKGVIKLNQEPTIGGHRPAVDPMMESVAQAYGAQTVGVILTGMGHDGTKGMRAIKSKNGQTIAEDQSTAIVYGMPKSVIDESLADRIAPLPEIAAEIVRAVKKQ